MTISTLSGKKGDPYFYLRNEDIEAIKSELDVLDNEEFMDATEKILDKMQPKLNSLQSKWGAADIGNLYFIDYISFEISSLLNEIEEKYAHNNIKEPLSKAILNCRQVLLYLYSLGSLKKRGDINSLQLRELTENQPYNFNDLIKILRTMIIEKIHSLLFSQGSKGIRSKDNLQRALDKNKNDHYLKLKDWFDNYIEPFSVENFQEYSQEGLNEKLFFHITLYTQPKRLSYPPERNLFNK